MLNAEIFVRNPQGLVIPNQGVTNLLIPSTPGEWEVLHWELSSFVAEGQYEAGLRQLLHAYLSNLDKPQQPSWWVSGFYGSGKSHFVRVLEYLWSDPKFPEGSPQAGASARGLVTLPQDIRDQLRELSMAGSREGGLWTASGTLGAGANGAVRLAFLEILFRAAGLPSAYPQARLEMWLGKKGVLEAVKAQVVQSEPWRAALTDMYVSPVLAGAIAAQVPGFEAAQGQAQLLAMFPPVTDVSDEETQTVTHEVLSLVSRKPGKLPCTLIVLDEVQQFIGDQVERALQVQQLEEMLSRRFGGKVLLIATGQSALGATPQLERIKGRFPNPLELSNADVENVVRQVVLRKKPDRVDDVRAALESASGEISRHLGGTRIAPRPEDASTLTQDYPVLPSRRRFWDEFLQAIDRQGSTAQLRNQLKISLSAAQQGAGRPLGEVVGADHVFKLLTSSMLSASVLLQDTHTLILKLDDGTPEGRLRQRLAELIFMISRLDPAAGVRATASVLADLLVEDLNTGSAALRQQIPEVLLGLVERGQLMLTQDEYRLQTREGSAWEGEYQSAYRRLLNDDVRQLQERDRLLKAEVEAQLRSNLTETQGDSKTPRKAELHYTQNPPPQGGTSGGAVPLWVRDEGHISAAEVQTDARKAGSDSATVFLFLPDSGKQALKEALAVQLAAQEVLAKRQNPATPEAREAQGAMNTRMVQAQGEVKTLITGRVAATRVFQGGGREISEGNLRASVRAAILAGLARLYDRFQVADHLQWHLVLKRAKDGNASALDALGYSGDPAAQPVLRAVLSDVGAGKKGSEVRKTFTQPPYGWPQDAVDAALVLLTLLGHLRALHNGSPIEAKALDAAKLTASEFRPETVILSKGQQMAVRGVYQEAGLGAASGQETAQFLVTQAPVYLRELERKLQASGGAAPLPERLSSPLLTTLQSLNGNELLLRIADAQNELKALWKAATERAETIARRQDTWTKLGQLLHHNRNLELKKQADAILSGRQLLQDPDPVQTLATEVMNGLRADLNAALSAYRARYDEMMVGLAAMPEWAALDSGRQAGVLKSANLQTAPELNLRGIGEVVSALGQTSLSEWESRTEALGSRFEKARQEVLRLTRPQAVQVTLKRRTLETAADLDGYLEELRTELSGHLAAGKAVVIS